MNAIQIPLIAGGLLAAVSLQALTLEVQRFAAGQPTPAGYQDVSDGIEPADTIKLSADPFVDYLIPNNSGSAGITAQKDGGLYISASNVDTFGGANNGIDPDKWHPVFEWEDGVPLPFGADYYGVTWQGWSNTDVATLTTRIELPTADTITIYHWFNDGWNYAEGGHTVLSGHVLTVTQYTAAGAEVASETVTLPSGGAESFFGDHRQFYSSIITASRSAEGDYLIITNQGGNVGHKGTAVALGGGGGGGDEGLNVEGIGVLNFVPADAGATAPVTGNTKLRNADGSLSDAAWSSPADVNPGATDALWRHRVTWGGIAPEMPGVFTNGAVALMPDLNTTVSVAQGTYDVYVVYTADRRVLQPEWTSTIGDVGGSVAAALSGKPLQLHDIYSGTYTGLFGPEINTALGYDFNIWGVFVSYVGTVFNSDTISVDIAPYVGDTAPGGTYRPTYHGIAYIGSNATSGPGVFGDYVAVDGWVDTGAWMGSVYVSHYPWVYSHALAQWLYAGGDNWFYVTR